MLITDHLIERCSHIVGAANVLVDEHDTAPYLTDWRGRFTGRARAVVRPASTAETAAVVRLCAELRVPVVPQGGRTGLVLGSVPDAAGDAIVLSLRRLNRIGAIDTFNRTMTVEAGCILQDIQHAAAEHGMLFPLSLAAEGSCTIGGNLSTNAGGTGVLRYGNTRELCLGLEVVTAQGDVWDALRGLRKDNTGYDLRDLYVGAEGTLGVITAAVLKLFPQPKAAITALVALATPRDALALLKLVEAACGPTLTGYELMSDVSLRLVAAHFPDLPQPFPERYPQYALLELSSHDSEAHGVALLERAIERALEDGLAQDAVVGPSALVTHARPIHAQHPARPPLAHLIGRLQIGRSLPMRGGRHHFFPSRSFSATLSSIASASIRLSLAFSSNSASRRRASDTSRPPYLAFHL